MITIGNRRYSHARRSAKLDGLRQNRGGSIRPFVVGRKGWLFSDTVAGAQASANLYSLVETCKANGVEPYRYLVWLFTRLPLAATADDYATLMPWSMPAALNR